MKKELNPPQFKYEPIDFKRKGLWMSSIDGWSYPEKSNNHVAYIVTGLMIGGMILAYFYK